MAVANSLMFLGVLILGGVGGAELGIPISGPGGVATFAVITVAGLAVAGFDSRRRAASQPPPEPASEVAPDMASRPA